MIGRDARFTGNRSWVRNHIRRRSHCRIRNRCCSSRRERFGSAYGSSEQLGGDQAVRDGSSIRNHIRSHIRSLTRNRNWDRRQRHSQRNRCHKRFRNRNWDRKQRHSRCHVPRSRYHKRFRNRSLAHSHIRNCFHIRIRNHGCSSRRVDNGISGGNIERREGDQAVQDGSSNRRNRHNHHNHHRKHNTYFHNRSLVHSRSRHSPS
jgi:hypothetical protein